MISSTILASVLGFLIPQENVTEEYAAWQKVYPFLVLILKRTGLSHVYTSWWFSSLLALTGCSILLCTLKRLNTVFAVRTIPGAGLSKSESSQGKMATAQAETEQRLRSGLFFYQKKKQGDQVVYLGTNRWLAKLGSIWFHFSILIIIAGFVLGKLYYLEGNMTLTEGEAVQESAQAYMNILKGPLFSRYTGFVLKLNSISPTYDQGVLTDIKADATLIDDDGSILKTIKVNQPLYHDSYKFVLTEIGPSPFFIIKKNTQPVWSAYLKLGGKVSEGVFEDYYTLETEKIELKAKVNILPAETAPSFVPEAKLTASAGDRQATSVLGLGQSLFLPPYEITLADHRYWAKFLVIKDEGLTLFNLGLFSALFGLSFALLWQGKDVKVELKANKTGTTRKTYFQKGKAVSDGSRKS